MTEIEYSDAMAVGPGVDVEALGEPPQCAIAGCARTVMRPGWVTIPGRFCEPCIDACYTSTDQPHVCPVCTVLGIGDGPAALNEPGARR
jgi:hypothetical protein